VTARVEMGDSFRFTSRLCERSPILLGLKGNNGGENWTTRTFHVWQGTSPHEEKRTSVHSRGAMSMPRLAGCATRRSKVRAPGLHQSTPPVGVSPCIATGNVPYTQYARPVTPAEVMRHTSAQPLLHLCVKVQYLIAIRSCKIPAVRFCGSESKSEKRNRDYRTPVGAIWCVTRTCPHLHS